MLLLGLPFVVLSLVLFMVGGTLQSVCEPIQNMDIFKKVRCSSYHSCSVIGGVFTTIYFFKHKQNQIIQFEIMSTDHDQYNLIGILKYICVYSNWCMCLCVHGVCVYIYYNIYRQ